MMLNRLKEVITKCYLVRESSEKKDLLAIRDEGITKNGDNITIKNHACDVTFTDKALAKLLNGEHVKLDDYDYYLKEYSDHIDDELMGKFLNYALILNRELVDSAREEKINKIVEYIGKNEMCYRVNQFYWMDDNCLDALREKGSYATDVRDSDTHEIIGTEYFKIVDNNGRDSIY